jgi:hypothetical protein
MLINMVLLFLWIYGAPTQFRSSQDKTTTQKQEKMILTNLGYYKLKAAPEVKTTSLAGAKTCIDSSNSNKFFLA